MSKVVPVNCYFSAELLGLLRAESRRSGCPVTELVRRGALRELEARQAAAKPEGAPADGAPQA